MRSVMQHAHGRTPDTHMKRSVFDRSHGFKTTLDSGYLVPILVDEALPSDTFSLNSTFFIRMNTPIVPIMDNLKADVHYWKVPVRQVWNNWERFNGAQDNPDDSIDYTIPQIDVKGEGVGTLTDYFGLPIDTINDLEVNSLPYRCYNHIYNEFYRDENLQDSLVLDKDDGPDTSSDYVLKKRGKRYDYFTSCLPWPQKGDAVELPLGTVAPVTGIGKVNQNWATGPTSVYETGGSGTTSYAGFETSDGGVTNKQFRFEEDPNNPGYPGIYADLSSATAATVNELRQAFQIQKILEKDARGGTRYVELLRHHFGITNHPDARLQRPEYLGGGSFDVSINPVAQTSETNTTPQGNLSAFGTASGSNIGFTTSFVEHCYVLGFISIRADLNYQNCVDRLWSRSTRYDFYLPMLANIGEQSVLNKEIYFDDTTPANNDLVFGYQERFGEMRSKRSLITGLFRSDAAGTIDVWHLAQDFASLPVLNDSFIQENPPVDRVIATPDEPEFILDAYHKYKCVRPMPLYGIPGINRL